MSQFWQGLTKASQVEKLDKVLLGKNADGSTTYADVSQLVDLMDSAQASIEVPMFVFIGESNSEGVGLNSDANSAELAIRDNLKIWNVTNSSFESLQVGVNNVWNNDTQFQANKTNWHGFELELANRGLDRVGYTEIYVVKCGQGGSAIQEWQTGSTYLIESANRINSAINSLIASGKIPKIYVFMSIGINNAIAGTSGSAFSTLLSDFHSNVRAICGQQTPIIMTGIPLVNANYTAIDTAISAFSTIANTYVVSVANLAMKDINHYSYLGLKGLANRLIDVAVDKIGLPRGLSGRSIADVIGGWQYSGSDIIPKTDVQVVRVRPNSDTTAWSSSPFRIEAFGNSGKFGYGYFNTSVGRFIIGAAQAGVANLDVYIAPSARARAFDFVADNELYAPNARLGVLNVNQSVLNGNDQTAAIITFGNTANANKFGYIAHDATDATTYIGSIENGVAHTNLVVAFWGNSKLGVGRKPTTNKFESAGVGSFDSGLIVGALVIHASAILQVDSTTKGVLLPRMTTTQINAISSPAEGLEVYNTTLHTKCFYDGSSWQKVTSSAM